MLDPSLTALLDHLNWSPPAIVQPAPASPAADQKMAAYSDYVTSQEQQLAAWIEHGHRLRSELWNSATTFNLEGLSTLIDQFEAGLKLEARVLARKEKEARRTERSLSGHLKQFVEHHQARLLKVAQDYYREGKDFASFLRAVRSELDPDSRGGPTFQDAVALQQYLTRSHA